jgi:hypothetical protein
VSVRVWGSVLVPCMDRAMDQSGLVRCVIIYGSSGKAES